MSQIHEKFMQAALSEAKAALRNGDFPVGCVMVSDGNIVASGRRLHSQNIFEKSSNEIDHAEIIALKMLLSCRPKIFSGKVTVYSTMEPCLMCYSTLLLNGISKFVYAYEDAMGGGTDLPLRSLKPLYSSMQISMTPGVLRQESLQLFKDFFSSSNSNYLKGSMLADYTLAQKI